MTLEELQVKLRLKLDGVKEKANQAIGNFKDISAESNKLNNLKFKGSYYNDLIKDAQRFKEIAEASKSALDTNKYQVGRFDFSPLVKDLESVKNKATGIKDNLISGLSKAKSSFKEISSNVGKVVSKTLKWGTTLIGVASLYGLIRTGVNAYLNSNEQLQTNIDYLKYSIGQALAPAIEKAVILLYNLFGIVGAIAQVFFGVNIFANSFSNYMANANKSATNTAKKAREIRQTLAGFDEIDNIQKDIDETGSGLSANIDIKVPDINLEDYIGKWIGKVEEFKKKLIDVFGSMESVERVARIIGSVIAGWAIGGKWGALVAGSLTLGLEIGDWLKEKYKDKITLYIGKLNLDMDKDDLATKILKIGTIVLAIIGDAVIDGVKSLWSLMWGNFTSNLERDKNKAGEIGENLAKGLVEGIENLKDWISEKIWNLTIGFIINAFKAALGIHSPSTVMRDEIGKNIVLGLVNGITGFINNIKNTITETTGNIKSWFSNGLSNMSSIGANIVSGITNGISSMTSGLRSTVTNLASNVTGWLKSSLGIHSPSTVMEKLIGRFIPLGIAKGVDGEASSVYSSMDRIMDRLTGYSLNDLAFETGVNSDYNAINQEFNRSLNINGNISTNLSDIFRQAIQDFGQSMLEKMVIEVNTYLDNKVIAKAQVDDLDGELKRQGYQGLKVRR